jgi:hypothetical protein
MNKPTKKIIVDEKKINQSKAMDKNFFLQTNRAYFQLPSITHMLNLAGY